MKIPTVVSGEPLQKYLAAQTDALRAVEATEEGRQFLFVLREELTWAAAERSFAAKLRTMQGWTWLICSSGFLAQALWLRDPLSGLMALVWLFSALTFFWGPRPKRNR